MMGRNLYHPLTKILESTSGLQIYMQAVAKRWPGNIHWH